MDTERRIAGRRLEVGLALMADGDARAAASAFAEAARADPTWAAARFALAEAEEKTGHPGAAAAAYARCLALDPDDPMGAGIRLALLAAAAPPSALPRAYVRTLFDQYAPRFEESLIGRLGYRAPWLLRRAVDARLEPECRCRRLLDLGCGTGLAGEAFRDLAAWLEGVDLSPAMLARARAKGIYDRLAEGEMTAALESRPASLDLVVAADSAVYVGDLAPLFAAARAALRAGGLVALTLQKGAADGFALGADHRFSHHPAYVAGVAGRAGLEVRAIAEEVARSEAGRPVPGLIVVLAAARLPPPAPAVAEAATKPLPG